ncbi:hypothetical protein LNQ81_03440 [Myroides sp. M-43]|uniref:hypothetical protein n=1 Tax=Myroides oncorhynchi TaxID=2893756 RepID=UPI001E403475|nr:hypothetical protein [Myroides oncorhynchi]MCC9041755.1 hypothetical protein [Myroides oncorhynchi]
MKKLLLFFSGFLLVLSAFSCSEDNTPDDTIQKELFVIIPKNAISVGSSVSLKAVDRESKEVSDVDFYVDETKITKEHKFDKRGIYNIVAKKVGYMNSTPTAIMVGDVVSQKLELAVTSIDITVREEVEFKVSLGGKSISGYYIEAIDNGLLSGNKWSSNVPGTFKFFAFKEGCFNSEEIIITVKPKEIKDNQAFTVNGKKYGVDKVFLYVDVKEENQQQPYFYKTEKGDTYLLYNLHAFDDQTALCTYQFAVFTPNNKEVFVLPSEVNPSDVVFIGGIAVLEETVVLSYGVSRFDKNWVEWQAPFDGPSKKPGKIKYGFKSKDGKLGLNYEGEFFGLLPQPVKKRISNSTLEEPKYGEVRLNNLKVTPIK